MLTRVKDPIHIKFSDDINYDIQPLTLRSYGFTEYFSSLAGMTGMKNQMEPPQGALEVFIGCGEVDSDVLKMGAVATPAEIFDQRAGIGTFEFFFNQI